MIRDRGNGDKHWRALAGFFKNFFSIFQWRTKEHCYKYWINTRVNYRRVHDVNVRCRNWTTGRKEVKIPKRKRSSGKQIQRGPWERVIDPLDLVCQWAVIYSFGWSCSCYRTRFKFLFRRIQVSYWWSEKRKRNIHCKRGCCWGIANDTQVRSPCWVGWWPSHRNCPWAQEIRPVAKHLWH